MQIFTTQQAAKPSCIFLKTKFLEEILPTKPALPHCDRAIVKIRS